MCYDQNRSPLPPPNSFEKQPTTSSFHLHVLFIFFNPQSRVSVISMCNHLLEHVQATKSHILKENRLPPQPQQPQTVE